MKRLRLDDGVGDPALYATDSFDKCDKMPKIGMSSAIDLGSFKYLILMKFSKFDFQRFDFSTTE